MPSPRRVLGIVATATMLVAFAASPALAGSDINGDGFDDLAVGVPEEDLKQVDHAGTLNVLKGSNIGIRAKGDRNFDQRDFGGSIEAIDRFGNSVAYGDFNGDGFDDIAVGAPTEDYDGKKDAGVVYIMYGSAKGVRARNTQLISQVGKMKGKNEAGDFFGAVLVSGDFDGDGFDDLAMGTPGEDVAGKVAAGGVIVAYGSSSGIVNKGSQALTQKGKVPGKPEDLDSFGVSLAAGDFNNDGKDDLAIGVPGEGFGAAEDAGQVVVLSGSSSGLIRRGLVLDHRTAPGDLSADTQFGYGLVAGDFTGDGVTDLATGAPGERSLTMFSGSANGLNAANATRVEQTELPSTITQGDRFGQVLAAGDFDGDGDDELAIGSQYSEIDSFANAGQVVVLGTGAPGIPAGGAQGIDQGNMAKGAPEKGDRMGSALRVGDFNGDSFFDIAIASAHEDVGNKTDSGVVHIVYGSAAGLDRLNVASFHQGTKNVNGKAEKGDRFGGGL